MKKLISVFFILQFLSNQTFAMELARIPVLFLHYLEHQSKEGHHYGHGNHRHHYSHHHHNKGFLNFLANHYGNTTETEGDHHHKHLPFKSSGCCSVPGVNLMLCGTVETILLVPLEENRKQYFRFNSDLKSQFHPHIWQPPKI